MSCSKSLSRVFLMVLPLLVLYLSGCTIVGRQIGNSMDNKNEDFWDLTPDILQTIPDGAYLEIRLTNGQNINGTKLFFSNIDSILVVQNVDRVNSPWVDDFNADLDDEEIPPSV